MASYECAACGASGTTDRLPAEQQCPRCGSADVGFVVEIPENDPLWQEIDAAADPSEDGPDEADRRPMADFRCRECGSRGKRH